MGILFLVIITIVIGLLKTNQHVYAHQHSNEHSNAGTHQQWNENVHIDVNGRDPPEHFVRTLKYITQHKQITSLLTFGNEIQNQQITKQIQQLNIQIDSFTHTNNIINVQTINKQQIETWSVKYIHIQILTQQAIFCFHMYIYH
jgi:hypothetical protein